MADFNWNDDALYLVDELTKAVGEQREEIDGLKVENKKLLAEVKELRSRLRF